MKRWFFPRSIASWIVMVIAIAGSIWVGYRSWVAFHQVQVRQFVDASGGYVDWRSRSGSDWVRKFFRSRLTEAFFDDITAVSFRGSPAISPDELKILSRLPRLQVIGLDIATIGDDHVAVVAENRELVVLLLGNSGVTDEGLAEVAKLRHLTTLDLSGTRVTDSGLRHLAPLSELMVLHLSHTAIGDSGLDQLDSLVNLETLSVGERVTDAGIDAILRHQRLKAIHFQNSPVTDLAMDRLMSGLPDLKELELFYTEVWGEKMKEIEAKGIRLQAAW